VAGRDPGRPDPARPAADHEQVDVADRHRRPSPLGLSAMRAEPPRSGLAVNGFPVQSQTAEARG
jgi:hypothetical protein